MTSDNYGWKRFWHPRGSGAGLTDDGYLYEPESKYGDIISKEVKSFSSLTRYPCLVLLGEPGTGKSHTIREEYGRASREVAGKGGRSLFVDLRSYSDESRLVADIFGDPTWASWSEGEGRLQLFLDSLDECLLNIKTVASLLKDKFAKYPADRLDLRIACRTADWPSILEDGLRGAWGKDEPRARLGRQLRYGRRRLLRGVPRWPPRGAIRRRPARRGTPEGAGVVAASGN